MAEFCVDCWNKLNGTNYTKRDVRTVEDLCEGCGEIKQVIVVIRPHGLKARLKRFWYWLEF